MLRSKSSGLRDVFILEDESTTCKHAHERNSKNVKKGDNGTMHKRNNEKREDEYVSICTERRWRSDRTTLPPSTPPMLKMKRPRSFTKKKQEGARDERQGN